MAVTEELRVEVQAEVDKAVRNMREFQGATKKSSNAANKLGKVFKRGMYAAAAAVSVGALTKAMKSSISAFQEQEEAEKALRSAVERNPMLSGGVAGRIEEFASELQNVSTVGDETAIRLASVAASSGRTEEEIKNMVQAAADVSAAMGITMDSAMRSLNKSFGGMTGELGELIPELQNLSKEQLEAGEGVDLVRDKFDGAAEAMGDTASGGLKQLSNAFGDLQERIGENLLQSFDGIIGKLTEFVQNAASAREEIDQINDAMAEGGGEEGLEKQVSTLEDVRDSARETLENYEEQFGSLDDLNHIQQQAVDAAQDQLDSALSQLSVKRELLKYERQAAAGQEALSEQEKRRQQRLEAFNEANELANEIIEERKDPMQREIESLNAQIDSLAEKREIMQKTGQWDEQYQRTINTLVEERDRLQEEYNEKLQDTLVATSKWGGEVDKGVVAQKRWGEELERSSEIATESWTEALQQIGLAMGRTTEQAKQQWASATSFINQSMMNVKEVYSQLMGQIQSIVAQSFENQLTAARNSQQEQIEAIQKKVENGVITEEEGEERIKAAKEQSAEEIADIRRRQAKAEKRMSIANAIMNTAVAVTRALQAGPIAGPILAGVISALGAAQVATIASQPIPKFATGGQFETNGPQLMMVGDNPGGRERVTVEPQSSSIGQGEPMRITVNIGERAIVDTVQNASRSRNLLIDARSVV